MYQQWTWCCNGKDVAAIHLQADGMVRWGDQRLGCCGRWHYFWDEKVGGFFLLEFSAGNRIRKRHILTQIDDERFMLLPTNSVNYDNDWWSPSSELHRNDGFEVTMVKVKGKAPQEPPESERTSPKPKRDFLKKSPD